MSQWLDVMLEEIRRKQAEQAAERAEHERRRGKRKGRERGTDAADAPPPQSARDRR